MIFTSSYNIGHSTLKPEVAIKVAKEQNEQSLIIADPKFYGFLEFYKGCKKQGIKPIFSITKTIEGLDVVIIMKNEAGYKYLIEKISTEITLRDLNHKDLTTIVSGFTETEDVSVGLAKLKKAYIGIYSFKNIEKYTKARYLYSLKENRKVVLLNIATHENEIDYRNTMIMQAIKEEKKFNEVNCLEDNFFIKETVGNQDWIDNMKIIEDSCVDDYEFDNPIPPAYNFTKEDAEKEGLPSTTTDAELFAHLSRKGLDYRLKKIDASKHQEYKERLDFEIGIINQMGFPGYMLIVADFVQAARDMDIPVGPGRGSAAGSLVAFSLKITNIDPLPFNLLFERFLNPERNSMPDIDMDFCQTHRQKVIEYVKDRYGSDKVAQIITYGKLVARGTIRDVARVMGYNDKKADFLAKIIPEDPGMTLDKAYEIKQAELDVILDNSETKKIWEFAKKLEGQIRNEGVHAAGLIISDEPVWKKAPTTMVGEKSVLQYEGKYTETVDLIKFDFLGLKTLSVIKEAMQLIKRNHDVDIDIDHLDFSDKKVYELISTGKTGGMFQIESSGMQALCAEMKPDRFEDLIAILALYRPGPMESGMLDDFVSRKNGLTKVKYFFDDFEEKLKPILEPTYGVIVYQEQVMKIVQEIGGFSLGEADVIRRAMGKKDVEYMNDMKDEFAEGAEKQGLSKAHAVELFDLIIKFAGYGFNKSHSAAYAMVSFQTAFLKTYYPAEFMAALMNFQDGQGKIEKVAAYVADARHIGLNVLKPDINTSTERFDTVDGKTITYSFSNLKGMGSKAGPIVKEREKNGLYESVEDLRSRLKVNKGPFNAMVYAGAFDSISNMRKGLIDPTAEAEFTLAEQLNWEVEVTGEYITDPFEKLGSYTDPYIIPELNELEEGLNYILIYPQDLVMRTAKKTQKDFGILSVFYNREIKEVLAFNDSVELVRNLNRTRPMILKVSNVAKGDSRTIFLNEIISFSKPNLEAFFVKKDSLKEDFINESEFSQCSECQE